MVREYEEAKVREAKLAEKDGKFVIINLIYILLMLSNTKVIHRLEMPNVGDELHHSGWNACSSCYDQPTKKRSRLVLSCFNSDRIYIIDTSTDEKEPRIHKASIGLFLLLCAVVLKPIGSSIEICPQMLPLAVGNFIRHLLLISNMKSGQIFDLCKNNADYHKDNQFNDVQLFHYMSANQTGYSQPNE